MGSFLLTTVHIINLFFVNQFSKQRSGESFVYRQQWGINILYNLKENSYEKNPGLFVNSKLAIIFDGSLYENYSSCTQQCDFLTTQKQIINLYKVHGLDFCRHLNGEFSLLLLDFDNRVLIISTDHLGTKPLFFSNETLNGLSSWSVATYPSSLQQLNLTNIIPVRGNTFIVWNVTVLEKKITNIQFWKTEHLVELDFESKKKTYQDWKAALIQAIGVRYTNTYFDEKSGNVVLGIARSVGHIIMEAALGIKVPCSPFSFVLKHTDIIELCYNMTNRHEPWNSTLFGDSRFLRKVSEECIRFEGYENDIFLSDLGAWELYFGPRKLDKFSLFLLQDIQGFALAREIVFGSFAVDIRSPFLDRAVVQEWLWLHPSLKAAVSPTLLFNIDYCPNLFWEHKSIKQDILQTPLSLHKGSNTNVENYKPDYASSLKESTGADANLAVSSAAFISDGKLKKSLSGLEPDTSSARIFGAAISAAEEGNLIEALRLFRAADQLVKEEESVVRLGFMECFQGLETLVQRLSKAEQLKVLSVLEEIEQENTVSLALKNLARYALGNVYFEMGDSEHAVMFLNKVISVSPWLNNPHQKSINMFSISNPPIVMTVATKEIDQLKNLRESAAIAGVKLEILGMGISPYRPWLKVRLFLDFLEELPLDQLVVGLDAYDVLMSPDLPKRASQVYAQLGCQVVVGAETASWPDNSVALLYPPSSTARKRRFVNSGNFIGTAHHLIQMMNTITGYHAHDDQRAFTRYFLEHPDRVCIDYKAELFMTLSGLEHEVNVLPPLGEFWVPELEVRPISLHGNGKTGQGLYDIAVEAWKQAIQHNTTMVIKPDPFMLGLTQFSENKFSQAAASFLQVLQQNPMHLEARLNLGVVLQHMGDWKAAQSVFLETVQKFHPSSSDAFLQAGNCAVNLQEPDKAIEFYQRGLALDPAHTKIADALKAVQGSGIR